MQLFQQFVLATLVFSAASASATELDGNWVRVREACGSEISQVELETLKGGDADQRFSIARYSFDGEEYSKALVPSQMCRADSPITDGSLSPTQNMYCGQPMKTEGIISIRDTGTAWKTIWFKGEAVRRNEAGEGLEPGIRVREKRFRREGMVLILTSDEMFSNCNFQQLIEYYVPLQGV